MRLPLALAATASAMLLATGSAHAASFDCSRARTIDEKAICANRALNDQDVRVGQLYDITRHLVAMGGRGAIQDDQIAWLRNRNTCRGNVACLTRSYATRLDQLNRVMQRVYSNGPF